ncbi:hypothetical protein BUE76_19350 [Cnuella takakiae]|nr:hypothetical protein BUE76_19350 [Cnuella takakiae]
MIKGSDAAQVVGKDKSLQYIQDTNIAELPEKWRSAIETQLTYMEGAVPFWFRANKGGNVPVPNESLSIIGDLYREYTKIKGVDWGGGVMARINVGAQKELHLVEAYAKAKWSLFQLKAGLYREFKGLVDSSLSSGSLAISGNANPIPSIQVSIPDFVHLPFLGKLISFKGSFEHGWIGDLPVNYVHNPYQYERVSSVKSYFHHKAIYGRLGKPNGRLFLTAGINHQVTWGHEKQIFGPEFHLKPFESIIQVLIGGSKNASQNISKVGNHLGTLDMGFDFNFYEGRISVYRQFIYDKGALAYLANVADGLTGFSVEFRESDKHKVRLNKVLLEVVYTKNQAGEQWSKETPSGPEQYYNHGIYSEGYSFKQTGIGSPFITEKKYSRKGLPSSPADFFINNRLFLVHMGAIGSVMKWRYKALLSYSQNYGTYYTSNSTFFWFNGERRPFVPYDGIFPKVNQVSVFFDVGRQLKKETSVHFSLANDSGKLLNNATGVSISLRKSLLRP